MELSIEYGKEKVENTLKEEEQDTIIKGEQDANIMKVQEFIIKDKEQEAAITTERQVVTMGEVTQAISIKQEEQEVNIKQEEEEELPVTVWNSLHGIAPLIVKVESPDDITELEEEAKSDILETQNTQPVRCTMQESVNAPLTIVKEDDTSRERSVQIPGGNPDVIEVCVDFEDLSSSKEQEAIITAKQQVVTEAEVKQAITIKQEEQEVTIKEEPELPVTMWNSLHGIIPLIVKVESPDITEIKEEAKYDTSEDTQTVTPAVQESVKEPLTLVKEDDTICLKSKPTDISKLCIAREISVQTPGRNLAEIEVCVDFEDLSSSKQDMLYTGKTHPSEKRCQKRTAVSDLVIEKLPKNRKKGSQCSSEASAVTNKIHGQDYAENLQEKDIETSGMSVSHRRIFALSVLRDQCLKVITQWYMGQPFSDIVHNMNLNPDSVRHILHVWCTEKRLACHKPGQGKIKGKLRTRKGQVPTLWKWRFLVTVGKNSTLQCMVCDKRLNSAKMENIACHIRNWHPYSAELPHRVRRAIHQAWKRRQQGLHKLHELQANCTEKREMTSLRNEQDKMTSPSLSMQQNVLQKPERYSHVQEIKNTTDDSRLCNQTEHYAAQHTANNEEKKESDTRDNDNNQNNEKNIQKTPSKKQRQIRYFQDQWRQKYLVDYDWKAEEVVCLVCGLRMRCLRSCTFERHAQRRHPESIHYSTEIRSALWESWNKGQHSFPLLNAGSGMSDFKVCSKRMESQPGLQKIQELHENRIVKRKLTKSESGNSRLTATSHSVQQNDAGLQKCWVDCKEEAGMTRLPSMLDKSIPIVQHHDRLPVQQRSQNCLSFQEQLKPIGENRLYNQDYTIQYETHYEDKESDTQCQQPDIQLTWNSYRKQNDMPQMLWKKQKHPRNFQEHWRQKYLVDYDWKTGEAVCILCGLHMRCLRTCTFERHAQRRHPESVHYPENTRNTLWKTWNRREHIYSLHHIGDSLSGTNTCQDEMERQPSWHKNNESSVSNNRLYNQIEDYTVQYKTNYEDKEYDFHSKQPDIQHTHRKQNYMPHVLQKKQKHMRNFQEYWRQKYLVDYDLKTEEAVCILCGLHMRCLRTCTFERHAQRRHPEAVHYPEKTRNALWETWNKGEHIYPLRPECSINDTSMSHNEVESQPSWHKNNEPSINTEEYMVIQQEQIECVLKSTNSQHEGV